MCFLNQQQIMNNFSESLVQNKTIFKRPCSVRKDGFFSVLLRNMTGKDNTMTKFIMRGTPLAGLEKQMMTPPNFTPRGGGRMILNRFRYRPEDVVCKNCTQCIHGKCSATICPWIEERAEAGVRVGRDGPFRVG